MIVGATSPAGRSPIRSCKRCPTAPLPHSSSVRWSVSRTNTLPLPFAFGSSFGGALGCGFCYAVGRAACTFRRPFGSAFCRLGTQRFTILAAKPHCLQEISVIGESAVDIVYPMSFRFSRLFQPLLQARHL